MASTVFIVLLDLPKNRVKDLTIKKKTFFSKDFVRCPDFVGEKEEITDRTYELLRLISCGLYRFLFHFGRKRSLYLKSCLSPKTPRKMKLVN